MQILIKHNEGREKSRRNWIRQGQGGVSFKQEALFNNDNAAEKSNEKRAKNVCWI